MNDVDQLAIVNSSSGGLASAIDAGLNDNPLPEEANSIALPSEAVKETLPPDPTQRISADRAGKFSSEFEKYSSGEHQKKQTFMTIPEQKQQRFANSVLRRMDDEKILWTDLTEEEATFLARSSRRASTEMSLLKDADYERRMDKFVAGIQERKRKEASTNASQDAINARDAADLNRERATNKIATERKIFDRFSDKDALNQIDAAGNAVEQQAQEIAANKKLIEDGKHGQLAEAQMNAKIATAENQAVAATNEADQAAAKKRLTDLKIENEYNKTVLDGKQGEQALAFGVAGINYQTDPTNEEYQKEWFSQLQNYSKYLDSIDSAENNPDKYESRINGAANVARSIHAMYARTSEQYYKNLRDIENKYLEDQDINAYQDAKKQLDKAAKGPLESAQAEFVKAKDRLDALAKEAGKTRGERTAEFVAGARDLELKTLVPGGDITEDLAPEGLAPTGNKSAPEGIAKDNTAPDRNDLVTLKDNSAMSLISKAVSNIESKKAMDVSNKTKETSVNLIVTDVRKNPELYSAFKEWLKANGKTLRAKKNYTPISGNMGGNIHSKYVNETKLLREFAGEFYDQKNANGR